MPVTLDKNENFCLLRLKGEIDITSATVLKALLLQGLAAGRELRVDLEMANDLDIVVMQLIWAAEREAQRLGLVMILTGPVPKQISAALSDAGFDGLLASKERKLAADVDR